MGFTIKKANQNDIEKLINLRVDLFKTNGQISNEEEYNKMKEQNRDFYTKKIKDQLLEVYYMEENDLIISVAAVLIIEMPPINLKDDGSVGYIFNVYTDEKYRDKGYATLLMQKIIESMRVKNIKKLLLNANLKASKLYERFGFILKEYSMELKLDLLHKV